MKADVDSHFKNTSKKKKWKQMKEAFLCFHHQNGFVFDVFLSHKHTLLRFVHFLTPLLHTRPPINHSFLMHYTLNTYVPPLLCYREGGQADYLCNLPFTYFPMTQTSSYFLHTLTKNEPRALVHDIMFSWKFY